MAKPQLLPASKGMIFTMGGRWDQGLLFIFNKELFLVLLWKAWPSSLYSQSTAVRQTHELTFFSRALRGICWATRANPSATASRPSRSSLHTRILPSVDALNSWMWFPCLASGSQWTYCKGAELRVRGLSALLPTRSAACRPSSCQTRRAAGTRMR